MWVVKQSYFGQAKSAGMRKAMINKRLTKQITNKSKGEFDSSAWIKEGKNLLLSSKVLRDSWQENHEKLIDQLKGGVRNQIMPLIPIDEALPRASILLIGYAIELFLKAALAQVFIGCSEQLFQTTARRKFSHNLLALAQFVRFPLSKQTEEDLKTLETSILEDGRYPLTINNSDDYHEKGNARTKKSTDPANYQRYRDLADKLESYARSVSGTSEDPVSHETWTILNDGYISLRHGGGIPGRVTFRLSREMEGELNPLQELGSMIRAVSPRLAAAWDEFEIYEEVVEVTVSLKKHFIKK